MHRFLHQVPSLPLKVLLNAVQVSVRQASGQTSSRSKNSDLADNAVANIATLVKIKHDGRLPLRKLLSVINAESRKAIVSSGKGIEGFLRSHPRFFEVVFGDTESKKELFVVVREDAAIPKNESLLPKIELPYIPPPPVPGRAGGGRVYVPVAETKLQAHNAVKVAQSANNAALDQIVNAEPQNATQSLTQEELCSFEPPLTEREKEFHSTLFKKIAHILRKPGVSYRTESLSRVVLNGTDSVRLNTISRHIELFPQRYLWVDTQTVALAMPKGNAHANAAILQDIRVKRTDRFQETQKIKGQLISNEEAITEVLKCVPIEWAAFSMLLFPPELKQRIFISFSCQTSMVIFCALFPNYFDLMFNEQKTGNQPYPSIRRCPLLHPAENGMTLEQAQEYVLRKDTKAFLLEFERRKKLSRGTQLFETSGEK